MRVFPHDDLVKVYRFSIDGHLKRDNVYRLPKIIECFVDRANQELPDGFYALPWTLNRAVTIFYDGQAVKVVPYDAIEDDIGWCLDRLKEIGYENR